MYKYKIVASDLDGTLLNDCSKVSEENMLAIKNLAEKGVYFVPSTGRSYSEILDVLKESDDIRYIIHSNGAVILDKKTGKRILNCIPKNLAARIFKITRGFDVHATVRVNGGCYVDSLYENKQRNQYFNFFAAHANVIENYSVAVDNFREWCDTLDNIESIALFFHLGEDLPVCLERLLELPGLRIAKLTEYCIEVFSSEAGKGNSLHLLADTLGIDRADTIAVGDSDNDFTMIKAAGLGLGVSNACDELKAICDDIICSNEEHAIDYIARHYFC